MTSPADGSADLPDTTDPTGPLVGVLGLQGDVAEHVRLLEAVGARTRTVRRPGELDGLDALILPGGESTTMEKLARAFGVFDPLREAIAGGLSTMGTCAGLVLLADGLLDAAPGQGTLGGLDVRVRRNAFGRQVDSFESSVRVESPTGAYDFPATFIRAPWVEEVGEQVEVVARVAPGHPHAGRIVAVRQRHLLAMSFHPEVTGDPRIHRMFVDALRTPARS